MPDEDNDRSSMIETLYRKAMDGLSREQAISVLEDEIDDLMETIERLLEDKTIIVGIDLADSADASASVSIGKWRLPSLYCGCTGFTPITTSEDCVQCLKPKEPHRLAGTIMFDTDSIS